MGERRSERRFRREPHLVEEGVRSGLAVLVGDPRMPWGVLAVYSRARRSFTDEEIAFVQSVGNLIAAAVTRWRAEELTREHARLIEESRFDERTRIARDLHDGLAQELWLARLRFGLLLEQITEPLRATEAAQAVTEAIDRAIASARAALGAIREEPRGSMDLGEELRLVIDELGERLDLETELVIRGRLPRTQPDVESEVMAIVREAVQNVGKHAGSRSVRVVASGRKRQIRVTIIDSGRGFDAGTPQATFGLAGMRERARLIGAELDIQSAVGTGTRVDLRVPMVDGPQS